MLLTRVAHCLWILLIYSHTAQTQSLPDCPDHLYPLTQPPGLDHLRYAPIQQARLYHGGGFVASVDTFDDDNGDGQPEYLLQPDWVAYQLNAYIADGGRHFPPGYKRPRDWYRLALFDLERQHYNSPRSVDQSYDGAGRQWHRGHLALRSDMNRLGEAYGCNSHVFANAVPQHPQLNAGIWLGLENYISSLSNQLGTLWVVSGPVYTRGKAINTLGEHHKKEMPVGIPDALFKVVIIEVDGGVHTLSFLFPNQFDTLPKHYLRGKCQDDRYYNFAPFLVSLATIEAATGLTFFSADPALAPFKKIKTPGLYALEPAYRIGFCNGGLAQPYRE
ncbi:MAG: DNA/RNA non-specific endonuclease [Cellvibrionaceae bacterium]|nr:DNA/RNA non-specific endonuclease [Cellvibrionaceae bacterium]